MTPFEGIVGGIHPSHLGKGGFISWFINPLTIAIYLYPCIPLMNPNVKQMICANFAITKK